MYTEILRSIEGIGIFPVFSLVLFVVVFVVVLVRVARTDRDRLARHAALPLADAGTIDGDSDSDRDASANAMSRRPA